MTKILLECPKCGKKVTFSHRIFPGVTYQCPACLKWSEGRLYKEV